MKEITVEIRTVKDSPDGIAEMIWQRDGEEDITFTIPEDGCLSMATKLLQAIQASKK